MALKNAGTATMRFREGIFVEGDSVHGSANQLVVTGSISVMDPSSGESYINFQPQGTWYEGSNGIGFRSNAGIMEFKDDGGDWTGLGESAPAGHDGAIQYNNNGALGGGNFFYDTNTANIGIGDFTNSDPSYLLTIQGDKGGTGNNGYVNIIEHNNSTGPGILYQRKRGSLASPTNIQDDDILGTDVYIGQVGGASLILGGFSTRYHSTNGTYMTFSVKGPSDSGNTNKLMLRDPALMPHPDITTGNVGAFVLGAASNAFGSVYVENIRGPQGTDIKFVGDNNDTYMYVGTQGTYAGNIGIGVSDPSYPLVVKGVSTTDPDLQVLNNTTEGPILGLTREESAITDITSGQTLAEIQMGASVGTQNAVNIKAVATTDWTYLPLLTPLRGTKLSFETTIHSESNIVTSERMYIDATKVHCNDDLECDGDMNVGNDLDVNLSATIGSNLYVSNDIFANEWVSNNNPIGITNSYGLMQYTDLSGGSKLTVNQDSEAMFFQYRDSSGKETFRCDHDGMTYIGTVDGEEQYSAYLQGSTDGGSYIEGVNSNGGVVTIVNRYSDGHDGDGLNIVIGKGRRANQNNPSFWFDEPEDTNYWIKLYGKDRGAAYIDSHEYDEFPPDQTFFVGGIQGDGSGGADLHGITFTGRHDSISSENIESGMIVESTGELWVSNGISTSLPWVVTSKASQSNSVFGVVDRQEINSGRAQKVTEGNYGYTINSLGEGKLWITNLVGEPTNGDYITSSVISGYGQLQDDDILHSYTVAKLTESIDWSSVTDTIDHEGATYKKYLAGCTYHCG